MKSKPVPFEVSSLVAEEEPTVEMGGARGIDGPTALDGGFDEEEDEDEEMILPVRFRVGRNDDMNEDEDEDVAVVGVFACAGAGAGVVGFVWLLFVVCVGLFSMFELVGVVVVVERFFSVDDVVAADDEMMMFENSSFTNLFNSSTISLRNSEPYFKIVGNKVPNDSNE